MDITITNITGMPEPDVLAALNQLSRHYFEQGLSQEDLTDKTSVLFTVAFAGDDVAGFKLGYEEKPGRFYSWLGGVDENFQGQGVGSRLMEEQHRWCRENGYSEIQTKTKNKWRAMLTLNLKHGFDIIGTYTDDFGEPKIILQKTL